MVLTRTINRLVALCCAVLCFGVLRWDGMECHPRCDAIGADVHDSLQETIDTLAQAEQDAEIRIDSLEVSCAWQCTW